jgi:hypothetical protein
MSALLLVVIILVGLLLLSEPLMAAINYTWWWRDYRCRTEPVTYELRRYAHKWWWVMLIKSGVLIYALIALLLYPPGVFPGWLKITILVVVVLGIALYGWLLLHLGGIAVRIARAIRHCFS